MQFLQLYKADDINCMLSVPAKENRVNIFDYRPDLITKNLPQGTKYNLGDYLGHVIVDFMLNKRNIDKDKEIPVKKHLYTVGSNIFGGSNRGNFQNATIWGSGILKEPLKREAFFQRLSHRKLDIRAVRGPLTKKVLEEFGHTCPSIFGDPAILMPLIYNPEKPKVRKYSVVLQFLHEKKFKNKYSGEYIISMNTNDYKFVIDEIVSSEVIYTSSLHGIILSEAYGIPAIPFRGLSKAIDFKYMDYYSSTGRTDVHLAETFEEALSSTPPPLPDLSTLQQGLIDTFPYDLWDS